jgi:outer membrane receptor protein involved in Fe transport
MGLDKLWSKAGQSGGNLNMRVLATHILSYIADTGVPGLPVRDTTGQLQQAQSEQTSQHWRILGSQSLDFSRWALTLTERWTSAGVIGVDYIQCVSNCPLPTADHGTINDNHVPATFYVDLGGRFDFSNRIQGYFKINNVADSPPTLAPVFNGRTNIAANGATGELLGRTYRLGVRVHY